MWPADFDGTSYGWELEAAGLAADIDRLEEREGADD